MPVLEEELAFGRSDEVELGKRGGQREGGELLKELGNVAEEALDGFVVEGGGLIGAMEAEGVGAVNGQGEGDAGEFVELEGAVGKGRSTGGAEGVGVVVVFEDEEVVEWNLGGAEAATSADEGKRGLLVGTEVEPVLAERLEEREEGLVGGKIGFEGEGVDEEADGIFRVRHGSVAAGAGGSENDTVFPGVTAQQEREGRLDKSI